MSSTASIRRPADVAIPTLLMLTLMSVTVGVLGAITLSLSRISDADRELISTLLYLAVGGVILGAYRLLGFMLGAALARTCLAGVGITGLAAHLLTFSAGFVELSDLMNPGSAPLLVLTGLGAGAAVAFCWRAWSARPFGQWVGVGSVLSLAGFVLAVVVGDLGGAVGIATRPLSATMAIGMICGLSVGLLAGMLAADTLRVASRAWLDHQRKLGQAELDKAAQQRRWRYLPYGIAALSLALAIIRQGMQPCGWLDRALDRSGCVQAMFLADHTIGALAAGPDSLIAVSEYIFGPAPEILALYRLSDGAQLTRFETDGLVERLAFSPDGTLLAGANFNGGLSVWRVSDGLLVHSAAAHHYSLAFSDDGALLLSGEELWRVADWAKLGRIEWQEAPARGFRLPLDSSEEARSPDLQLMVRESAGAEPALQLLSLPDERLLRELEGPIPERGWYHFSPDGAYIAGRFGYSADSRVLVWRVSDGTLVRNVPLEDFIDELAWGADSRTLFVAHGRGRLMTIAVE